MADQTSQGVDTPPPEEEEDDSELPLSQPLPKGGGEAKDIDTLVFRVNTEDISVEELARECIISLSSPQNNPQWLKDELRIQGALDKLANMGEEINSGLLELGGQGWNFLIKLLKKGII